MELKHKVIMGIFAIIIIACAGYALVTYYEGQGQTQEQNTNNSTVPQSNEYYMTIWISGTLDYDADLMNCQIKIAEADGSRIYEYGYADNGFYDSVFLYDEGTEYAITLTYRGMSTMRTFIPDETNHGICEISLDNVIRPKIMVCYKELFDLNGGYYPVKYVQIQVCQNGSCHDLASLEEANYKTSWYYLKGMPIEITVTQGNMTFTKTAIAESDIILFWEGIYICNCPCL